MLSKIENEIIQLKEKSKEKMKKTSNLVLNISLVAYCVQLTIVSIQFRIEHN